MKLRPLVKPRILCHVNSGKLASFLHDNWTELGLLYDIIGPLGPQVSGIPIDLSVADAVRAGAWRTSSTRNPILLQLRQVLPSQIPDIASADDDYYMWRNSADAPPSLFSTYKVWISLNPPPPVVSWCKAVWFSQRIPKHAFILWLILKNRMLTRDRLRSWGLVVPAECLLCGHAAETVNHLVFECQFSVAAWNMMLSRVRLTYPVSLHAIILWLTNAPVRGKLKVILKLVFQALVYFIWKERNSRLHSGVHKPEDQIVKEVQLQIRAKLLGLDREKTATSRSSQRQSESYISTWFESF
ncbi:hypothetical protein N665_0872s0001 [Sinapis alba]|nr:hypothetical protein N665_0872s0001 [Sinapis alba]